MNAERKKMIDRKVDEIENEKQKARRDEVRKYQEANAKCKALSERVCELIQTANYLLDNDIQLPKKEDLKRFGYDYDSWAEGFYHGVGFLTYSKVVHKPVEYVGIIAGGFCGKWDFYMSGGAIFCKNYETGDKKPADLTTLERFIDRFPKFESAFYAWVDDFCGGKSYDNA